MNYYGANHFGMGNVVGMFQFNKFYYFTNVTKYLSNEKRGNFEYFSYMLSLETVTFCFSVKYTLDTVTRTLIQFNDKFILNYLKPVTLK